MINKKPEFWGRIIAGLLLAGSIIFLIIKNNSEEGSIKGAVWMVAIFGGLFLISLFGKKLYQLSEKLRDKEKSQRVLEPEDVKKIISNILSEWWNYPKIGTSRIQRTVVVDNNLIYVDYIKLYRPEIFTDESTNKKVETDLVYILINASKSINECRPQVLDGRCGKEELTNAIADMARSIRMPTNIQETELINDPFGRPQQKTRITSFIKEEKKEDDVE